MLLTQRIGRCAAALVLVIATAASAREVELALKDGRQIAGELVTETSAAITVRIKGIDATIPRTEIKDDGVHYKLNLQEQYQEKRDLLADDDLNGHFELARWLYDQKTPESYKLSLAELDSILTAHPDHQQASLLRSVVQDRIKSLTKTTTPTTPTPTTPKPPTDKPETTDKPPVSDGKTPRLLTPEEMNLIRVYEVDIDSQPPPVINVTKDVIEAVLKKYRQDPILADYIGTNGERKLLSMDGADQLKILFKLQARDFYKKVQVREEPANLKNFKTRVNATYLVRYCGACHGEGKTPGFFVFTQRATVDQVAYTNLILAGRAKGNGVPFLVPGQPESSALVQYGLPRKDATTPHPDVRGWKPFFSNREDKRYLDILDWIKSLYKHPDDYPIEYKMPAPPPVKPVPGAAPAAPGAPGTPAAPTPPADPNAPVSPPAPGTPETPAPPAPPATPPAPTPPAP